jgi:hypothetical protein
MESCCTGLRNLIACAGQRGLAAVAWIDSSGECRLLLQSRGVSLDDQAKLRPAEIDVNINLSAELGMRYCPFCGRLFEELIHANREFFHALAKEHKQFLKAMAKF